MSWEKSLFCDTGVGMGESCYCQQSLIILSFHASLVVEGVFDRASMFGFLTLTGRTTSLACPLDMTARIHLSSGSTKRIHSEPGIFLQHTHPYLLCTVPQTQAFLNLFMPLLLLLDSAIRWYYNTSHSPLSLLFVNHHYPRLVNHYLPVNLKLEGPKDDSAVTRYYVPNCLRSISMLSATVHPCSFGSGT